MKVVVWGCGETHYEVQTCGPHGIEDDYTGGNSPWESTTIIAEDHPQAIPPSRLREFAETTARETVQELIEDGENAVYGGEDEDVTESIQELEKAIQEGRL